MEYQTIVPSFLYTPPKTFLQPPVETRIQELPFSKLSWEDFEKLCLRLVQIESDIIHCQLYGERGQDQAGIDFYAREKNTSTYKVYQCKRVRKFNPSKIKEAVDEFIVNEWSKKSKVFILCTSESMTAKEKADELECQSMRLHQYNIEMQVWDSNKLSIKLKQYPVLVDDFFGRPWVTSFCGVDASNSLHSRFDNSQLFELREKLSEFYKLVFNTHDPGLPIPTKNGQFSVPLQNRYVVPDIVEKRNISLNHDNRETEHQLSHDCLNDNQNRQTIKLIKKIDLDHRIDIESWLLNSSRNVILGGPGSGKSTFLRFLAIDILSDEPTLNKLAQKYGGLLPIWIPFALWTKHLSYRECSLSELLELWFKSWNEERLWPLIQSALAEERLLLLVDGLDESANISTSQIAMDRLAVFVEQRKLPIIITSRPHGFSRLITNPTGMQVGELGSLSINQQKQISLIWFSIWTTQMNESSAFAEEEILKKATVSMNSFMDELGRSQDLKELVKLPLLLTLLISLRLFETRLPQNRFKAYDKLVDHLISIHPQRRQTAAGLVSFSEDISDEDLKMVLANLAFKLQSHYLEGVIEKNRAINIIETQLKDSDFGFGLGTREAHSLSKSLIELGENTTGLLVNKSQVEIGFFHRAFQEYLAAIYITTLPFETQIQIIDSNCTDSQWREVILALMQLNSRSEEVKQIILRIMDKKILVHEKDYIDLLLYEATFGSYNLPPNLIKVLTKEAFSRIESDARIELREQFLKIALEGLKSSRTKDLVSNKISEWFPGRSDWRRDLFLVVANWEINDEVVDYLFRGLFDESFDNKKGAAEAIVLIKDQFDLSLKLINLVKYSPEPLTVAAAFHALLKGWISHKEMDGLIDLLRLSVTPELRLYSIWARVLRGVHNEIDLMDLLKLSSRKKISLEYSLRPVITNILIQAWPNSEVIKEACIDSILNQHASEYQIESEIAYEVLLTNYYQDNDVINLAINELRGEFPFNTIGFNWSLLINFRESEEIIQAVDEWIVGQEYRDKEISFAALVGKTTTAKHTLISKLQKSSFPHWIVGALIEGWGIEDYEVEDALKIYISESTSNASKVANYIPKIIMDKKECYDFLIKILMHDSCNRYDFCLSGLKELGHSDGTLDMLFELLHKNDNIALRTFLFQEYPSDPRVCELAMNELFIKEGNYIVIAEMYKDDVEIKKGILQLLCPLTSTLRRTIAQELSNYLNEDNNIITILRNYDLETDDIAKTAASISYHNYLNLFGVEPSNALELLSRNIVCYGHDYQERRQAAFVGLISLKRLDLMESAVESIGKEKKATISLASKFFSNDGL